MTITITHTAAEGTLVEGTSKGDGTNTILRAHGFRWFRTLGTWGIAGSRDRQPNEYKISRAAAALREAGHTVDVEIDRTHRPADQTEADKVARQQDRADALADKADRKHDAAEQAWNREKTAHNALPEGGEPIHVGHHSEARHRNAIDKAWNALGNAVAAEKEATRADDRADAAAATTGHRYSPQTVANRIERFEAEQRADQRTLDGHSRTLFTDATGFKHVETTTAATGDYRERVIARMAQRADDITYWKTVRAEQIERGQINDYSRDTISKGDYVKVASLGWLTVTRVNAKSVTVTYPAPYGGRMLTDTVKYPHLRGHTTAERAAEILAQHQADTAEAG
ncbi:DUF3560 domain-containing protein [Williamsia sp.]|uniref:DUF3560 domain-containing protein n=1 Tax=Williamsia sp. TaxID=1872085 RepID=UPI002F95512B